MNATLFMLTSAMMAGADPAPEAAAPGSRPWSLPDRAVAVDVPLAPAIHAALPARPLVALQVEFQAQQRLRLQRLCFYPGLHHGVCADRQVRSQPALLRRFARRLALLLLHAAPVQQVATVAARPGCGPV